MKKFRGRQGGEEHVGNLSYFPGEGVLPIMIYKEKLRPKEVPSLYKMKYKKVRNSGLSLPVYNFFQYLPPHHIEDNSFSTMIGILYQSL